MKGGIDGRKEEQGGVRRQMDCGKDKLTISVLFFLYLQRCEGDNVFT